jgi:hypothetical protein
MTLETKINAMGRNIFHGIFFRFVKRNPMKGEKYGTGKSTTARS